MQHVTVTKHFTYLICLSQLFRDVGVIVVPILQTRKRYPGGRVTCLRWQKCEWRTWDLVQSLDFIVHALAPHLFVTGFLLPLQPPRVQIKARKVDPLRVVYTEIRFWTRVNCSFSVGMTVMVTGPGTGPWGDNLATSVHPPCLSCLPFLIPKPKPPDSQTRGFFFSVL